MASITITVDSAPSTVSSPSKEVKTNYLSTTGRPRKASVGRPRRNSASNRLTKKIPTKLTVPSALTLGTGYVNQLTSHFSHIAEIGKDPYPLI